MLLFYSNASIILPKTFYPKKFFSWPKFHEGCWNYYMIPVHSRAVFILPSRAKKNGKIVFWPLFCRLSLENRHSSVPSSPGSLVILAPQTKLQALQIETWNTINQWRFCQYLECQVPCTNAKPPVWKVSSDGSESAARV